MPAHYQTVVDIASEYGLDPKLVFAIVMVESSNRTHTARYERHFRWLSDPASHAGRLGITEETEIELQKFSWGLMQVMGGTARDLGYNGFLPELIVPQIGVRWGCLYLSYLTARHRTKDEVVAAYNAGSVRRLTNGEFVNQRYVDKVRDQYLELNGGIRT